MADASELQYTTIEEFPGIYNAPGMPAQQRGGSNFYGFVDGVNAPIGAATDSSYGCVPGPDGKGLIPGPGKLASRNLTIDTANFADALKLPPYKIVGVAAIGANQNFNLVAVAMWYVDSGGTGRWKLMLLQPDGGGETLGRTVNVGGVQAKGSTLTWSRMDTAAPYTAAGKVVLAYNASIFESGVYPDPTAPGVNAAVAFATIGRVIAHQGRVILLQRDTASIGGITATGDGEKIRFTDPVNSNVMGTQDQVFYPEFFSGYGAWGSLSAGSLLLIKASGGAVLVEGDIASPRLTYLPGVRSTGQICSISAQTKLGLLYATESGVFSWAGGASSEKISAQLEARFWENNQLATNQVESTLESVRVELFAIGDYVFCTGNWMLHVPTKTWWRLANPDNEQFNRYTLGSNVTISALKYENFYAFFPIGVLSSGTVYTVAFKFSCQVFAQTWFWESHPIPLTQNTDVIVEEIVIEAQASSSAGAQTMVWTLTGPSGATQTGTATITSTGRPQRIVIPVSMIGDTAQLSILAACATTEQPAPMLHRVHIGYREHNMAPVQ